MELNTRVTKKAPFIAGIVLLIFIAMTGGNAGAANTLREIVFIDGAVSGYQQLAAGVKTGAECIVLDPRRDELAQISTKLQGRSGLTAIHLITHGAPGQIMFDTTRLTEENLAGHTAAWRTIGNALVPGGDLLVYGCNVARGTTGQSFIESLARITRADVAASDNPTGAVDQGGDWVLEAARGRIDTAPLSVSHYAFVLANNVVTLTGTTDVTLQDGTVDILDFSSNRYGSTAGDWPGGGATMPDSLSIANVPVISGFNANEDFIDLRGTSITVSPTWDTNVFDSQLPPAIGTDYYYTLYNYGTLQNKQFSISGNTLGADGAPTGFLVGYIDDSNYDPVVVFFKDIKGTLTAANFLLPGAPDPATTVVPSLTATGATPTFTEGGGAVSLFSGVTAATNDSGQTFSSMTLTVSGVSNGSSEALSIGGTNVALTNGSGTLTSYGSYAVSVVSGIATVTLSGLALSDANMDILVTGIAYNNTSNDPTAGNRVVTITQITDNGSGNNTATISGISSKVTVEAVNDAPTATVTGTSPTYTENGSAVDLFSGVAVSATEMSQNITQLTLTVSNLSDGSSEILRIDGTDIALTNTSGGTTTGGNLVDYIVSITGSTATVTLSKAGGLSSANTQTIIDNMSYRNSSESPGTTSRVVKLTSITDNGGTANGGVDTTTLSISSTVTVIAVNDAPSVSNLGGDSVSFTEDGNAIFLDAGNNATLSDSDSADFDGGNVTVSITGNKVSTEDELGVHNEGSGAGQIGVSGSNITYGGLTIGTYSGGTSGADLVVTLDSNATPAAVQSLVRNLVYNNTNSNNPATNSRTVRVTLNDGDGGTSSNADITVSVTAVNDAPTINEDSSSTSPLNEDDTSPVSFKVSSMLSSLGANDVDSGALLGIAIINADGYGVWQYSTNNYNWNDSGTVSATGALLLSSGSYVRYKPDGKNGETAKLTWRVWDQTSGTASTNSIRNTADTTINGGTSAYSSISNTFSIPVKAVNDAPTLSGGPFVLTGTNEDTVSSGTLVSTILTGLTYGDYDASPSSGIAIIAGAGNGTWQYSTDGATWNGVGSVSDSAALLLSSTTQLRYVPDGKNSETPTLTFRAWDQTSGSPSTSGSSNTGNTTTNGGTTAFSTSTAQASLAVSSVNDAPTISGTVASMSSTNEDTTSTSISVSVILTVANYQDADSSGVSGIAVTAVTGNGTWQYSLDGSTWNNFGTVSATGALLLSSTSYFRYQPDGKNGGTASFIYRGWDQTSGTVNTTTGNDTTTNGEASAYSSVANSLGILIYAVNDAPTITTPGSIAVTEDIPTALTGISFADVDAGSGSITVTLSVGSGTLQATSGSGVTVSGSGTTLTLNGTISNINAFIATGNVSFTTASNAASSVTLSILIDDGGNTGTDPGTSGTGSSEAAAATVTLAVTAVNDAPVNSVPSAQSVKQDSSLIFNSSNGNLISISDVDAGANSLQVTLTSTHGVLTIGSTSGLSFIVGSGTADSTMTFTGAQADVNAALNGLRYMPTAGYNGSASIQITTSDLGSSGSGGARVDTDTISITVTPLNPTVTSVSASMVDGSYKVGDTITLTVTFDQAVTVDTSGGTPTLLLETGSVDRMAIYIGGSGTTTLSFGYEVLAGDASADLEYAGINALVLNGATIRSADNQNAVLTLPAVGGARSISGQKAIVVDGIAPTVSSVSVPANGTYITGQNLDFTVNYSEAVTVVTTGGMPYIPITLNTGGTINAAYQGGSGTTALVFRYTVVSGNSDNDGVTVGTAITANGGTLKDAAGNNAALTLNTIASTTSVLVDGITPAVSSVSVPGNGTYIAGQNLDFTVNFSEAVTVITTGGTPYIPITLSTGGTVNAAYQSGSGTTALVFRYTVVNGNNDNDGVTVGTAITANGGIFKDAAGNNAALTLNTIASTTSVLVDGIAPTVSSVSVPGNGTYIAGQNLDFTVNFNEAVTVVTTGGTPYIPITLNTGGTVNAAYQSGSGTTALVFRYTIVSGNSDNDGITVGTAITANGGTLKDAASNDAESALHNTGSTAGVLVDTVAPTAPTVTGTPLTNTPTPTWSWAAGGGGNGTFRYRLDNSDLSTGATETNVLTYTPASALNDGSHILYVQEKDAAGNWSTSGSFTIAVDTVPPATPNVTGTTPTNDTTPTWSWTASGGGNGTFRYKLDDGDLTSGATETIELSYTPASALSSASHTLYVQERDDAGNWSISGNFTIVVDTAAPTITTVTGPQAGNYTIGQNLDFTVTFSEAVTIDTSGGTPYLMITLTTGSTTSAKRTKAGKQSLALTGGSTTVNAVYQSGSGTNQLVFRYTIAAGNQDLDGIEVSNAVTLNGGSISDSTGNSAPSTALDFTPPDTTEVDVIMATVGESSLKATVSGSILSINLDSTYYDYLQVYLNGTQYNENSSASNKNYNVYGSKNLNVTLPTTTGSYSITIVLYDLAGGSKTFSGYLYNVRVKYVPGKGDGFGWEMWK